MTTARERIEGLKAELERARRVAVALEQQVARAEALADDLWREGNRNTRRRSYAQGVAFRYSASRIRATLHPEATP